MDAANGCASRTAHSGLFPHTFDPLFLLSLVTVVLSQPPLKVEIVETLEVRLLFSVLPSALTLL
jgi:hypothetical protein